MSKYTIAVIDSETDPFKHGRVPKPFVWGFYDGEVSLHFWGEDCNEQLIEYLNGRTDKLMIYAHNGGKFDYIFLMKYLSSTIKIVNGRILKAKLGRHELRDSYAILPIPLKAYEKDEFDYDKMEPDKREANRREILKYLEHDCLYLYELVTGFQEEFGNRLTIGGTAIRALKEYHSYDTADANFDAFIRQFYYGGRCQAFETGILKGDWKVYDVNSEYPTVMKDYLHPVGTSHTTSRRIDYKTDFAEIEAINRGCLPRRTKTGITFTEETGTFLATGHEIRSGLEHGTLEILSVKQAISFHARERFDGFVNHFYSQRMKAEAAKDKLHKTFYKLILNSSYGRFALNPENQHEYVLIGENDFVPDEEEGYELHELGNGYSLWRKPSSRLQYENIATAASITGAARSMLHDAIVKSERVVYCDTDSIICEFSPVEIHPTKLGAWKQEAVGDTVAIAGKKMYALFDGIECVKSASKGARLDPNQIVAVARGETVTYRQDAPTFSLGGQAQFIVRNIRATGLAADNEKFATVDAKGVAKGDVDYYDTKTVNDDCLTD